MLSGPHFTLLTLAFQHKFVQIPLLIWDSNSSRIPKNYPDKCKIKNPIPELNMKHVRSCLVEAPEPVASTTPCSELDSFILKTQFRVSCLMLRERPPADYAAPRSIVLVRAPVCPTTDAHRITDMVICQGHVTKLRLTKEHNHA